MKTIIIFCCLIVATLGQVPEPCNPPLQWSSQESRTYRMTNYREVLSLYYDEIYRRQRYFTTFRTGMDYRSYNTLLLYNENKNYTTDLITGKCTLTPINGQFRYRGVHPDAKFEGFVTLGATGKPREYVQLASYAANETSETYFALVTYPHCYPVQHIHASKMYGIEQSDYYNLRVGIDEDIFTPPEHCTDSAQNASPSV